MNRYRSAHGARALRLALLSLLAAFLLLAGCASSTKMAPGFGDIEKGIDRVTIMPPAFTLQKVGAFASEPVAAMTHDIETELKSSLELLVDWTKRYQVAVLDASDQALEQDPQLREAIYNQQAELDKAAQAIADTKGGKIDVDYLADIDYIADKTGSDYFLFVRGGGFFKTTGAQVKEAVIAGISAVLFGSGATGPGSATSLTAYLVDANRGKVIWCTTKTCKDKDPRKPSHLFETCKQTLKPLVGNCDLKGDKSRDDLIIDRYKDLMQPGSEGEKAASEEGETLQEEPGKAPPAVPAPPANDDEF